MGSPMQGGGCNSMMPGGKGCAGFGAMIKADAVNAAIAPEPEKAAIRIGARVKVSTTFQSDDYFSHSLTVGKEGVVREIDADGDAHVKFQGFAIPLQVAERNFDCLQVVA